MKPYRVLIVEDHPFQHEFLRNLFSTLGGFSVEAVWDGATALQRLNTHSYDMVVTDLFMPVMDGVQLIQSIARLGKPPALALMSVASRRMLVSAGLVAKNLDLDVLGLISKPVDACDIMRLRDSLNKRRSDLDASLRHPTQPARQCLLAAMQRG
ncbi:response regulator, partial [Pseudomonas viridiflava]|uniref:response regulator n=1 Tax=Pseudomonas viridiflava TaxID=33069 RepID=UPI000F05CAA2